MEPEVVVFASTADESGQQLATTLERFEPVSETVTVSDLDSLKAQLQEYPRRVAVLVLLASDRSELRALVELEPLLSDIPLLLVVPDAESTTVALAHRLRPRLLSYAGDGFETIGRVVARLLVRHRLS